jgi:hypothetical protein
MEDFQDILLDQIHNKIYSYRWPGKQGNKDEITKQQKFNVFKKDCVLPQIKNLHWDIREKISLFHLNWHVEKLKTILHDIPSFTKDEDPWEMIEPTSTRLVQHILQTIDYMYSQKIIKKDAYENFLQSEDTLQIASLNRVSLSCYQEGYGYFICPCLRSLFILNEWHSQYDRRFFSGKLK